MQNKILAGLKDQLITNNELFKADDYKELVLALALNNQWGPKNNEGLSKYYLDSGNLRHTLRLAILFSQLRNFNSFEYNFSEEQKNIISIIKADESTNDIDLESSSFKYLTRVDANGEDNKYKEYLAINKTCLGEFGSFLDKLVSEEGDMKWDDIIKQLVVYHDIRKGNQKTNVDPQKAFHEEESADYFKTLNKRDLGLTKNDKKITEFLIRNHIVMGIPVIGELSSEALQQYFKRVDELSILEEQKKNIIKLAIIHGYLDSAASVIPNGVCGRDELVFYYYLWLKIEKTSLKKLSEERVFYPSYEGLKQFALTRDFEAVIADEKTEYAYRIFMLNKKNQKVFEQLTNPQHIDYVPISELLSKGFYETRYYMGCFRDDPPATWVYGFKTLRAAVNNNKNIVFDKIIMNRTETIGDSARIINYRGKKILQVPIYIKPDQK